MDMSLLVWIYDETVLDQVAMIHQGMGDTHVVRPTAHVASCRVVPDTVAVMKLNKLAELISETDFHP